MQPPPINSALLDGLIGMYRGIVTRNTADTGKDSVETLHAQKILDHYLGLRAREQQREREREGVTAP